MDDVRAEPMSGDDPDDDFSVVELAFLIYQDAGLMLPPVPRDLVNALDQLSDFQFGTAELSLTGRAGFLAAAADPATAPELAFGHTGHGVSSWWMCYRLIRGPLAVFVRQSYGGAYDDDEPASRAAVNGVAEELEELIVKADAANLGGRRMIVVLDDVEGSFWQVTGGAATEVAGADVLPEALIHLEARSA